MITARSPALFSRPLHGLRLGFLSIPAINRWANTLTLKAFANSSPGLRFGNPGITHAIFTEDATLKGLRRRPLHRNPVATPSELRRNKYEPYPPGFQSKPWAKISQRFQRKGRANTFSVKGDSPAVNCWASIIRPLCGLMNLLFLCEAIWHLNPGTACSIGRFGFLVFIEAAVHRDEERCPGSASRLGRNHSQVTDALLLVRLG
jgi:hypothetical protein